MTTSRLLNMGGQVFGHPTCLETYEFSHTLSETGPSQEISPYLKPIA